MRGLAFVSFMSVSMAGPQVAPVRRRGRATNAQPSVDPSAVASLTSSRPPSPIDLVPQPANESGFPPCGFFAYQQTIDLGTLIADETRHLDQVQLETAHKT